MKYRRCTQCVMDTDDPEITFDHNGVCNYCRQFKEAPEGFGKVPNALQIWMKLIQDMKKDGLGKPYDCVMGISGGVDSSYLCHVVKEAGLRSICVHVDNGFNSEFSKRNMGIVLEKTGFDCEFVSVDPEEFRSLLLAYLRASVLDTDVPADYAIEAVQYRVALKYGLKHILSGWNYHNEAFMPSAWTYRNKNDHTNLRNIHNRFGEGVKLRLFPHWGALEMIINRKLYGLRKIAPLNYVGYTKKAAVEWLKKNWGWQEYKDKHGENIFSRFYQRYILYTKFGIDKRKSHYSNLIRSGGMTRAEACEELKKHPYDPLQYKSDKAFILKKLRIAEGDLTHIMAQPPRKHAEFGSDERWINLARRIATYRKRMRRLAGRLLRVRSKRRDRLEVLKYWLKHDEYEPAMQRKIKQLKGDVFVDLGANIGFYSIMMRNNFRKIYAFEPNVAAVNDMRYYFRKFGVLNAEIFAVAASDKDDEEAMAILDYKGKPKDPITGIQYGSHEHMKDFQIGVESIKSLKLSTFFLYAGLKQIDLVKMDVEGNDLKVLEGAEPIMDRIKSWIVELHPWCGFKVVLDLKDYGYNIEWLSDDFIYADREMIKE